MKILFWADVGVLLFLISGAVWSIALPDKRLWPPPRRQSWQYYLAWFCFYFVFLVNTMIFIVDWNSGMFSNLNRLVIGIPLIVLGLTLLTWAVMILGIKNTGGIRAGFVNSGPYHFTRNPQYLGDMVLFVGLSICANSWMLWITHLLLIIVFILAPLAEERWLEETYGEDYLRYKTTTSRFL